MEKSNKDKYLIFVCTHKNKKAIEKYTKLEDEIKYLIKTINGDEAGEYNKDFMKVKFESDDNLSFARTHDHW